MKAARCNFFQGMARKFLWEFMGFHGIKMVETWYKNGISLWKITIFNGKIHDKWSFSIVMLNYQRVNMGFHEFLMVIRKMVMCFLMDFSSVFMGRSCEYHGIFHEESWDLMGYPLVN